MVARPSWDEYFITIAQQVASRSTCLRAQVGAVVVREKRILATGYNGAPSGLPHCLDMGCLVHETRNPDGEMEQNCFRAIHAEMNAVIQAAKHGMSIDGASVYLTHSPCFHCLKVLVNVGIKEIFYRDAYKSSPLCEELVRMSGVKVERVEVGAVRKEAVMKVYVFSWPTGPKSRKSRVGVVVAETREAAERILGTVVPEVGISTFLGQPPTLVGESEVKEGVGVIM